MPIAVLTPSNLRHKNLYIGVDDRSDTRQLSAEFKIINASGELICPATNQMDGARLSAPKLFGTKVLPTMPNGARPLEVKDKIRWTCRGGHFVIEAVEHAGKTSMQECPKHLPNEITAPLSKLQQFLLKWPSSRLDPGLVLKWDKFIDEWATDSTLPLLVRKSRDAGTKTTHGSRDLWIVDNSPAHWVLTNIGEGIAPESVRTDPNWKEKMPIKFLQLVKGDYPGKHGWYVAHRTAIKLNQKGTVEKMDLEKLIAAFRRFMKPSNMFLMPRVIAGLAEIDGFFEDSTAGAESI